MKTKNYFVLKLVLLITIIGLITLSKSDFKMELIIIFSIWSFFEWIVYGIVNNVITTKPSEDGE